MSGMDEDPTRRSVVGLVAGAAASAAAGGSVEAASPAKPPSDIVMLDAVALAGALRAGKLSCVEVMGAYLDHIAVVNPKVNAIVALQDRAGLLAQAREKDAQRARGEALGPLHGLPHAVKDLQPVKGIVSTSGSPILKDFVPAQDSLMVERLRTAGAVIIGKTNTPEFGLGSHTFNPVYGATHNAYDPGRSAGGSSGGAAVGLATRMLPVADGSDYGGSLRNPAGWNNVFGFRTSIGRVPSGGPEVWLPSMGVAGPMARNVPDLALLLSVQAGYDPREPLSMSGDGSVFRAPLSSEVKGRRIGWLADLGGYLPYEPGVLELCRSALKVFETLGCEVEEARPDHPPEPVWGATIKLRGWQQGASLVPFYEDPARRALLKPEAVYEIETGLKLSAHDLTLASGVRTGWTQAVRKLFARYDYLVMPTAQTFPFDIDARWPREIAGRPMRTYHEWMQGVLLVTMTGCPSLAVPAGFGAQGLPMGLQIIGPNHGEMACLELAHAYDQATRWPDRRRPPMVA